MRSEGEVKGSSRCGLVFVRGRGGRAEARGSSEVSEYFILYLLGVRGETEHTYMMGTHTRREGGRGGGKRLREEKSLG